MSVTRRTALGGAAAWGLMPLAAVAATGPPPLTFAAVFPFTGEAALLGDESFRGLALAVDALNTAGGLLKTKVALMRQDARDPEQATAVAKAVTKLPRVAAIFGTAATPMALAASSVAGLAGLPYFELTAIGGPITGRGLKFLFRSCPEADAFALTAVQAVVALAAPGLGSEARALRLGVLSVAGEPGPSIAAAQVQECKRLALNLPQTLSYPTNTLDFTPLIRALRGAEIDVLLHTGFANDIVLFFRGLQQADWRPRVVIGCGPAYGLADTRQAVGAALDGTLATDFPPYTTNPHRAHGAQSLESAYRTRYGADPRSGLSLAAYTGAGFFFSAIARANSTDRDKLRNAVLAANAPCGTGANGWGESFATNGQNCRAEPVLLQWQDGRAVAVFPPQAALAPALFSASRGANSLTKKH